MSEPIPRSNPITKEFTVPEANPVTVSFTWIGPDAEPVTKGFTIPPAFVRVLNQYCIDMDLVTEEGEPDTLRLFMEHNLAKLSPTGEVVAPGLIYSLMSRYKDYAGAMDPVLQLKKAALDQAVADFNSTQSALLANALQPIG